MKLKQSLVVIAGLDPAIHAGGSGKVVLDRRVKPGDDTEVVQSDRTPL